ncbi:MAG: alkaline phosphatase D family protein [Gammaproteobacteria bacterium]|jgi:phosphodiesterase/alkaline phosphatase D-like protein|nr:alkaline phosphatase D family protein [Gammaproteobacteria bacterium]
MTIDTLILSNTEYSEDSVGLTLAATFSTSMNPEEIYLELKQKDKSFDIKSIVKDAINTDPLTESETHPISTRHLHFPLSGLIPNEPFTYQIKRRDNEPLYVAKAIGEDEDHLHQPVKVISPPKPGQRMQYRLVISGDQEAVNAIKSTTIDDKVAKALGLSLDQREVTTKIYKEMQQYSPDLFYHLGDVYNGENIIPYKRVKNLEDFRTNIEEDFHTTVRDTISSAVSFVVKDDHDLGANGASADDYAKHSRGYDNAVKAFNEFWPVPTIAEDNHRGLFYRSSYGDIETWFLHNRLDHFKGQSLLGENQLHWLRKTLEESKSPIKFIVSPLPFVMGKKVDEDYRAVPDEWNELLTLFAKNGVSAIFTADSHNYSRADIKMKVNGEEVTIPQFLVGTLGGSPQVVNSDERHSMPKPSVPVKFEKEYTTSKVHAYYTPMSVTDLLHPKKYRAFKDEKWIGKDVKKNEYGYLTVDVDVHKNQILTSFHAMRLKTKEGKKETFTDSAQYQIRQRMK